MLEQILSEKACMAAYLLTGECSGSQNEGKIRNFEQQEQNKLSQKPHDIHEMKGERSRPFQAFEPLDPQMCRQNPNFLPGKTPQGGRSILYILWVACSYEEEGMSHTVTGKSCCHEEAQGYIPSQTGQELHGCAGKYVLAVGPAIPIPILGNLHSATNSIPTFPLAPKFTN